MSQNMYKTYTLILQNLAMKKEISKMERYTMFMDWKIQYH